ncbi:unnamed protein product [Periconia digitata]|uniref:Uncharacterized protein n=1 Tax=Periconia digitata TaxID=1303443 RepID=A0A9W4XRN5_9PLEO|nr:unnamed protein product [Periconia digitata]
MLSMSCYVTRIDCIQHPTPSLKSPAGKKEGKHTRSSHSHIHRHLLQTQPQHQHQHQPTYKSPSQSPNKKKRARTSNCAPSFFSFSLLPENFFSFETKLQPPRM